MRIVLSNASVKWGGVHAVTELLARGLVERGHEVTVFGAPDSALEQRMKDVVPFEPILHGMDLHPLALWRAGKALRRHRAQVVVAMMKKDVRLTVPAAWAQGIPSVVRYANDRPLTGWIYDRLFFGFMPVLHIANSEATRATLLASAGWLQPSRIRVIHNGIDRRTIDSVGPRPLNLPANALTIGFAGRLETRKGLLDLMKAWAIIAEAVPKAHLVIVGEGPDEAEAKSIAGPSPRIHWLGYRTDVPAILHALDIAVVPSHWEGFGMIAAEAMLAGVPVVAARASSLPEIVEDGVHGRLVPPRDPEALAAAIIELALDPKSRTAMGIKARERARTDFTVERMLDSYEEALQQIVEQKQTC